MFAPLLLLVVVSQFSSLEFHAGNAACWSTSNFHQSQPLVLTAYIPENRSKVELITTSSRGDDPVLSLRSCSYPACTTFQYYNANCPIVASLSFGVNDVTNLFRGGRYELTLDSLHSSSSTEIASAVLNVTFPVFEMQVGSKTCSYGASDTKCSLDVRVVGSGECSLPTSAVNASIFRQSEPISVVLNARIAAWNCTSGEYAASLFFPPLVFNQSWRFLNSNISSQAIESTVFITNPTSENLSDVPLNFSPLALPLTAEAAGLVNLSANTTAQFTKVFEGKFVEMNLTPFVNFTFDLSITSMVLEMNISSRAPIQFNFATGDLNLSWFNCDEKNFSVAVFAIHALNCSPPLNYSFSNQSQGELDLLTYTLFFENASFEHSFTVKLLLPLAGYSEVSLENSSMAWFQNGELFARIFNETVFNLTAKREVKVAPSVAPAAAQSSFYSGAASGSVVIPVFENISRSSFGSSNASKPSGVVTPFLQGGKKAQRNPMKLPKQVSVKSNASLVSALATSETFHFPLETLLLIPLAGFAFFFFNRKRVASRRRINSAVFIVVNNFSSSPMHNVVVQELLPPGAQVKTEARKKNSVIGKALLWRRKLLAPGEKWSLSYSSTATAKKGKLLYSQNGVKTQIIF